MAVKSYGPKWTGVGANAGSVNVTDGQAGNSIYVGTTAPSTPSTGDIWIDNATGATSYLARWKYTASGGETSLSGLDDSSSTLTYTPANELVTLNGVQLVRGVDYLATSGTTITGLTALVAGDVVTIISFLNVSTASVVPATSFTAAGDILVGTGSGTWSKLSIGTSGQVLTSNGTTAAWASVDQDAFAFSLMTMGA